MSTEENKANVRRVYEEAINQGNMAVVDELVSPDYVGHDPGFPQPMRGPEGLKQYFMVFRTAAPDTHITIEDMIAEGNTNGPVEAQVNCLKLQKRLMFGRANFDLFRLHVLRRA